ncbi:hypothetical protein D3C86_309950 [compost metagenome]
MWRSGCGLALVAATLSLLSPTPVHAQSRGFMALGAAAAPPAGMIGFCRRTPDACRGPDASTAEVEAQIDAATRAYWGQLFVKNDPSPPPGATNPSPPAPRSKPSATTAAGSSAQAVGAHIDRSHPLWPQVIAVNTRINAAIRAGDDHRLHAQDDYWTIPRAAGRAKPVGDCEDFALTKREQLLALGVPADALSIALVTTRTGLSHAVLLVATDEGEYVLDNLSPWVIHWSEARLTWRERQAPGEMLKWVKVVTE